MSFEKFYGFWLRDKGSESAAARELIKMNLNTGTKNIEVVHIGFHYLIIYFFKSEGRGRKSIFEKYSFRGALYNMSLVSKYFKDSSSTINLIFFIRVRRGNAHLNNLDLVTPQYR